MTFLTRVGLIITGAALCLTFMPLGAGAETLETERMSWLINRDGLETLALTGLRFEQDEIGGDGGGADPITVEQDDGSGRKKSGWPVLFSLILPGSGEVSMGYKRGWFMMAADILAWTQVYKYHHDGKDYTDQYIAFADAHYRDDWLVEAYKPGSTDIERAGEGNGSGASFPGYFPSVPPINDESQLTNLPLYVSKEDDFR